MCLLKLPIHWPMSIEGRADICNLVNVLDFTVMLDVSLMK